MLQLANVHLIALLDFFLLAYALRKLASKVLLNQPNPFLWLAHGSHHESLWTSTPVQTQKNRFIDK